MKKFLIKISLFALFIILFIILGLVLPTTPMASKSSSSYRLKDSLLTDTDSPRMIFIGGSNVGMGLNCQMIKDSLNVNPVNTGTTAGLGIKFMFENTAQYVKQGDIIIAPLEYVHFTQRYDYCSEVLVRAILDGNRKYLRLLNLQQALKSFLYLPRYAVSKFNPRAYFAFGTDVLYNRKYNRYGDQYTHWDMENRNFVPFGRLNEFNRQIISKIKDFEKMVEQKGAVFYITYPSYMAKSFYESEDIIAAIRSELEKNFKVLGTPERYMIPDSLMFDSPYHPNKKGLDIRTARLIEDIKNAKIILLNE